MQTIKLRTSEVSQIWFTSDLHIGHKNICRGESGWDRKESCRNFDTIQDMNNTIIDNINKYVKPTDDLFILGDILFGNKIYLPEVIRQINCINIYLILGNHDNFVQKNDEYIALFSGGVYDALHLEISKSKNIILNHYSQRVWMGSHKGFIHLFGHSHGSMSDYGKSMDVGIDAIFNRFGEYRPISFDEIIDIMNSKDILFSDHHNEQIPVK